MNIGLECKLDLTEEPRLGASNEKNIKYVI